MSHSVPSDSSSAESLFLVGAELVEFDRRDLPIYVTPQTLWADAGRDRGNYGISVDRVFGDSEEVHIASLPLDEEARERAEAALPAHDALVVLQGLADGLTLTLCEPSPVLDAATHAHTGPAPGVTALFEFGPTPMPVHDGWNWDAHRPDWAYDHQI
jgi:hypothetical protein